MDVGPGEFLVQVTVVLSSLPVQKMVLGLLCLSYIHALLFLTFASPVEIRPVSMFTTKSERTWLWGWAWGTESTVSVVDRSPVVSFPSRPGMSPTRYLCLVSL